MPSTLSSLSFRSNLAATIANADPNISGTESIIDGRATALSVGSGVGEGDGVATGILTITAGTPVSVDLLNLAASGLDTRGLTNAPAHLMLLKLHNLSSTLGQNFSVGGGANALFAALPLTVNAGGDLNWCDGENGLAIAAGASVIELAVAAGTGVQISVTIVTRST